MAVRVARTSTVFCLAKMRTSLPGSGSASVSLGSLGNGVWHVYAMVSDGKAIPQEIYATSTIAISGSAVTVVPSQTDYTVAEYVANPSAADAVPDGLNISDTAANVSKILDTLNADPHVDSIAFTDTGTPTLTLSVAQALDDTTALGKITSPHTLAILDGPADIAALTGTKAGALRTNGFTALNATAPVTLTLTEADLLSGHGLSVNGTVTIDVVGGALKATDKIDGGSGSNTLALEGPGTFNLALPTTLTDVQTITATEGQAAYSGGGQTFAAQNQIVVLRAGLNATVNVDGDTSLNANDPKPATITIVGAANSDVINLASGNDVVTVGGPDETVNLGSGNDTINVNAATIGATIGNGTGHNTLDVTGGGAMMMGSHITDIAEALLSPASTAYRFTANAISGLTINDSSTTTADVLTAGGAHQTLTGGGAGKVEFVGAAAGDDTFKNLAALFNGDTVSGFGDNGDVIDLTDVSSTGLKPLSYVQTNGTLGKLTVSDGMHTAAITLLGQYVANGFHPTSDGGVGTAITYQPAPLALAQIAPQHA